MGRHKENTIKEITKEGTIILGTTEEKQAKFWEAYVDPESDTFGRIKDSAMAAGFSESWANTLRYRKPEWFEERVKDVKFIEKANRNMEKFLDMDTRTEVVTKSGEVYTKKDAALTKIQFDATKFVLERLYKDKWSPRQEVAVKAFDLADLHKIAEEDIVDGEIVE